MNEVRAACTLKMNGSWKTEIKGEEVRLEQGDTVVSFLMTKAGSWQGNVSSLASTACSWKRAGRVLVSGNNGWKLSDKQGSVSSLTSTAVWWKTARRVFVFWQPRMGGVRQKESVFPVWHPRLEALRQTGECSLSDKHSCWLEDSEGECFLSDKRSWKLKRRKG